MSKAVFKFRVHTGIWDEHGEKCLLLIGGGLKPDGASRVWLTAPDGRKIFSASRKDVEPISNDEAVRSILNEREIAKKVSNAPKN